MASPRSLFGGQPERTLRVPAKAGAPSAALVFGHGLGDGPSGWHGQAPRSEARPRLRSAPRRYLARELELKGASCRVGQ